jgi:hypothetical protein
MGDVAAVSKNVRRGIPDVRQKKLRACIEHSGHVRYARAYSHVVGVVCPPPENSVKILI